MVLSPDVDESGLTSVVDRVTQFINEQGGYIANQEAWGLRKLAYPIQKFEEGNYTFTDFDFEPSHITDLDARLKSSLEIIRYLLVKKEVGRSQAKATEQQPVGESQAEATEQQPEGV